MNEFDTDGPHIEYQVGDVANGHIWDGTSWQVLPTEVPQPLEDHARPWYKMKRVMIPSAAFGLLALIIAVTPGQDVETVADQTGSTATAIEAPAVPDAPAPAPEVQADPEPAPAPAAPAQPAPAPAPAPESSGTASQQNALRSAESYLEFSGFSRQGLIDQLSSEYGDQFTVEDATWAVDRVGADWNEQAVRSAESYLEFSGFSRQGLIDQLSSEYGDQFTVEQATFAANQVGL